MVCILKVHPLKVQLLSFLDISVRIEENKYGFVSGQIEDFSLLDNPLVSSDGVLDDKDFFEGLVDELQPIMEGNSRNPWFNMYLTNFESSNNKSTSVCVLSQEVIQSILEKNDTSSKSCCDEEDGASVEKLSILLNVGRSVQGNVLKDFYVIGSVRDRAERRSSMLLVNKKGMQGVSNNITLELALFPFLFPSGNGAYDGKISLQEYLRYRMTCLFSPFTLYKPYLLLMYDVRQALMLINATKHMCLEKDYQAFKVKNPTMSNGQIISQIVKYKLPETLTGSSSWHRNHLNDLMAFVDMYGLPHLFVTLTCDKTSELRWTDIVDLEKIIKKLGQSFSWKDCPVEYTHLFHTRVKEFLADYIIVGEKVLGQVKHYVI